MSIKVDFNYEKTFLCRPPREETFKYFCDFQMSVGENFPGLQSFERLEENTYAWEFEPARTGNNEIQIKFSTRFTIQTPSEIKIEPIPNSGNTELKGSWTFRDLKGQTEVTLRAILRADLDLPFILKPIVGAVVKNKVSQYFERYAENVVKSIA